MGLIGNESIWESGRIVLRQRIRGAGPILLFLAVIVFAGDVRAQRNTSPGPSTAAEAGIPDAPLDAGLAGQLSPEEPSPGSIHGVVVDRDGSVYEGTLVTLTLTAPAKPMVRTAISDSNGRFTFADVPPGAFKLAISSRGFGTQEITGVLHSGESYEAKAIVLLVTSSSEVEVTATREEIAEEELHVEETQRVFGVIPNFYVSYAPNAPPLTKRQKFELAWKSSIDPFTFLITGAFAGVEQADNTFSGYGQGAQGYAKRYGANYADGFIGTMIGGALLPSLWKQDPRYFYKGTGTIRARFLYALANSVICKGDSGHWQANYSGILGGMAAGGISNLYYPASDRNGVTLTFENALIGTAGSAAQNLFQEFLVRRLTPKAPNYGSSNP
jgi:hypothetical protein